MSPLQHALLFGGICFLAAVVICWSCCVSAKRQGVFDADLTQHRTPHMGDPRWDGCDCPPCPGRGNDGHRMTHCAECCFGSGVEADPDCPIHGITPIHDELAAQYVIASAERHARGEWEASS